MLLFRFNLLISSLLFCTLVQGFSDIKCLDSRFEVSTVHPAGPLGISENKLSIDKSACEMTIALNYLFFLKKQWVIDVCRGPVHIKKTSFGTVVLRSKGPCLESSSDEFCIAAKEVATVLQDDGLVFANGEKEQLASEHGKVYCSYLLIKKYTDHSFIFSREKEYQNILETNNEIKTQPLQKEIKNEIEPLQNNDSTESESIDETTETGEAPASRSGSF